MARTIRASRRPIYRLGSRAPRYRFQHRAAASADPAGTVACASKRNIPATIDPSEGRT